MNHRIALLFVPALLGASFLLSSCLTITVADPNQPGPKPGPTPGPGPTPMPQIGWHLNSQKFSYDLDIVVNGRDYHVDNGYEHFDPHPVSTRAQGVGPNAISAYEVHGPDGETTVYWAEMAGSSVAAVYRVSSIPTAASTGPPRRLRSIRL